MLILSRFRGESVVIDLTRVSELVRRDPDRAIEILLQPITVVVADVRGGEKARLAFDANAAIRVDRYEVARRREGAK